MEDSGIIDLFFERSEQAIALLSEKYGRLCQKIACNILNDRLDAEECVNDAYLAVWNTVPPMRPESLPGYLCRIVRNLALKKYHGNTAKKRNSVYDVALDEIADCIPSDASVEEEAAAAEISRMIDAFLGTLCESDRIMFVRRYYHADSIEDLAAAFGKSRHYVSVRLSRIRSALKKHLCERGITV